LAPTVFRRLRPDEYARVAVTRPQIEPDSAGEPSLRSQSLWLMSAKFVTFVLGFVLPLLVVRFLDQSSVGTYRQAFQLITNAMVVLPLGFGMSAYYYLSTETSRRASAVFNILLVNSAVGIAAFVGLAAFPGIVARMFNNPELTALSPLIGAVVCVWTVSTFLEVVVVANREPRTATLAIIIAQLTKTSLMVSAVVMFASVEAFLAAALVQGILQTVALFVYLHSRFPRFWRAFDGAFLLEQSRYVLPLGLAGLLWTLQTDVHFYFVGSRFSAAEFAVYAYGCFQLPLVWMLAESINSVLIPKMSRLAAEGDRTEAVRLLGRSAHKLALVYMPLAAFLAVTAEVFVVTMFTESYAAAVPVFLINLALLPFQCLSLDAVTRAFKDLATKLLVLRAGLSSVLVAVLYMEGTRFGLTGIIATVVAVLALEKVVMAALTARRLSMSGRDIAHFLPVFKTALAALIAAVVTSVFNMTAGEPIGEFARSAAAGAVGEGTWSRFVGGVLRLSADGAVFGAVYLAGILYANLVDEEEKSAVSNGVARLGRIAGRKSRKSEVTV